MKSVIDELGNKIPVSNRWVSLFFFFPFWCLTEQSTWLYKPLLHLTVVLSNRNLEPRAHGHCSCKPQRVPPLVGTEGGAAGSASGLCLDACHYNVPWDEWHFTAALRGKTWMPYRSLLISSCPGRYGRATARGFLSGVHISLLGPPWLSITDWAAQTTEACFLTVPEARNPRSKYWKVGFFQGLIFLACRWPNSFCILVWPFLCACTLLVSLCVWIPSDEDTSPIRLTTNNFNLIKVKGPL